MSETGCTSPIAATTLVEYWVGELDAAQEARVEEHLLACGDCTAAFASLVDVADGIRALVGQGAVKAVVTHAFLQRLADAGVRLREYRVPRDGSVYCTVAPEDEVLVALLEAPLAGVAQVDLVLEGVEGMGDQRLCDVPFDRARGEVVLTPPIQHIRKLGASTSRMRLIAVGRGPESVLGEYTFVHTPWRPA